MLNRTALFIQALNDRILVLDGAMGTMLQSFGLKEEDFRKGYFESHPVDLKGNNDVLCLTRPDAVASVHRQYLDAGADIIETNTFNSNAVSQGEYQLADSVFELAKAGAEVARRTADEFTEKNPEKPRFVAGSMGPTGRTLSMSPDVNNPGCRNLTFDELAATYQVQAEGLIAGGADLLLVETIFDTLNAKAAAFGIMRAAEKTGIELPVMFSGTVSDASGRLLAGQNVEAFLNSVLHTRNILSVGFNCALGAEEMRPHIVELAQKCPVRVSAHPNAGLPDELGRYKQTPEHMGQIIGEFAKSGLVNIVGGCCGTNPDHIREIAKAVAGVAPRRVPEIPPKMRLSGLEPLTVDSASMNFINVGERTNVAGSRKFLNLIKADHIREALQIARNQVENGAQIIDINMDDAMLEPRECMKKFLLNIASEPDIARVPIMIDSSKWDVILEGLKCVQGKCVVNSISLKEGEELFLKKAKDARMFGAAVLCMAFDENGQADTVEKRVAVCKRMFDLLTGRLDFPPQDIIFDPNVFAVATGLPEHDNYAKDFIEAVRRIHEAMPLCHISGGISNVSFSFRGNETVRGALHSVFLYHAIKNGLDMGIVNPGQLAIYEEIEPGLRTAAENVILNRTPDAADRLLEIAAGLKESGADRVAHDANPKWRTESLEKRIEHALVKGDDSFIQQDMEEALGAYSNPVSIIEGPLMSGMGEVGTLFAAGKMFLPQVVKTARVMKSAVACLMPHIQKARGEAGGVPSHAGTVVLATVKGDVHDIGKNIVAVVLQCNNYKVVDLGVMTPMQTILDAVEREKADVLGLSGLITPSLEEMAAIAREMDRRGMKIPLFIGGATTSLVHTALKLQPNYSGPVVYTRDASQCAPAVNAILNPARREAFLKELRAAYADAAGENGHQSMTVTTQKSALLSVDEARKNRFVPDFAAYPPVMPAQTGILKFTPPDVSELLPLIDWNGFLRTWDLRIPSASSREAGKDLMADAKKMLDQMIQNQVFTLKCRVGIFPAVSENETINLYQDEAHRKKLASLPMLRQQLRKENSVPNYALSDLIADRESGLADHLGLFVLSAGFGIDQLAHHFKRNGDDYSALLIQTLADRIAEAFSEYLHWSVRTELWGYDRGEALAPEQFRAMKYRGIRPAPGYPPCPDHTLKGDIFRLLHAEKELGINLTEHYMMTPAASVCGFYFASPESRYFNVGKVGADQLGAYAKARGMNSSDLERYLAVPKES